MAKRSCAARALLLLLLLLRGIFIVPKLASELSKTLTRNWKNSRDHLRSLRGGRKVDKQRGRTVTYDVCLCVYACVCVCVCVFDRKKIEGEKFSKKKTDYNDGHEEKKEKKKKKKRKV